VTALGRVLRRGVSEVHFLADLPLPRRPGHRPYGNGARTGRTRATRGARPGNARNPGWPRVPDTVASWAGQAVPRQWQQARLRGARRAGGIWRVSESFPELAQAVLEHARPGRIDVVRAKRLHACGILFFAGSGVCQELEYPQPE
jgi:hypothetical protein